MSFLHAVCSYFFCFLHSLTHTEESEYQTDYDEDAVLSEFDLSNPNSEHSEQTEDEEDWDSRYSWYSKIIGYMCYYYFFICLIIILMIFNF